MGEGGGTCSARFSTGAPNGRPLAAWWETTDKDGMAEIKSREDLEAWLRKQGRVEFAQVIAMRCALRVLPYAFRTGNANKWINDHALRLIRACAISWAIRNFPTHDMSNAAADVVDSTANRVATARSALAAAPVDYAASARASAFAAVRAAAPTASFVRTSSDVLVENAYTAAVDAVTAAAAAALSAFMTSATAASSELWRNVNVDCDWIERHRLKRVSPSDIAQLLTYEELWPGGASHRWKIDRDDALLRLEGLNQGYKVWIDWYNRRLKGHAASFDIPGDVDRAEDKAILARLADVTNLEFWGKGAEFVNTTLQRWIDEACQRTAANADETADPEPQNRDVISFRRTELGQFDPDFDASADELLVDPAACDRHLAFVTTAGEALSLCNGHNQIGHVAEHLKIVIEAAGDHPRTMRVDLLVARGERMVADVNDAVEELQPDPKAALSNLQEKRIVNVLQALVRDYTVMIKLDPALDRRQRLPDEEESATGLVSPQHAIVFVNSSLTIGAITQASHDIVIEGVQGLSEKASPKDRRQWRFSEMVRNLPRSMIGFLWAHRTALVGSSVAGVTGVAMALITQEAAIRGFFATNPGMLRVIDELVNIIRTIGM